MTSPSKKTAISNPVLGMLFFIFTELMVFSAFISAYSIVRSSAINWPPLDQPRLPVLATAFNSAALLLSGFLLYGGYRFFLKEGSSKRVKHFFFASLVLGLFFVCFQGWEWVKLIRFGLTMTSSVYGSFFYLIIGFHGLHVLAASFTLSYAYHRLSKSLLRREVFAACLCFWIFVVGVWPCIYYWVYF